MNIFPAIDLYEKQAVRLLKGDYAHKTVYSDDPIEIAYDFEAAGARFIHVVDLEGAKEGFPPNFGIIKSIKEKTRLFVETGGGIRKIETVKLYIDAGIDRVILGTAAVEDPDFLKEALGLYGEKIAVGVDLKDGFVATKGWTEKSAYSADEFMKYLSGLGVKTVIATDISKDGAMQGTNRALYKTLSESFDIDIIASGGVSDMDDISNILQLTTVEDVLASLRELVRLTRQREEWTQANLARRSGIPTTTISRLERTGLASTDTLFKVLFALNRLDAFADMLKEQLRLAKFPKTLEGDFEYAPKVMQRVRHRGGAK